MEKHNDIPSSDVFRLLVVIVRTVCDRVCFIGVRSPLSSCVFFRTAKPRNPTRVGSAPEPPPTCPNDAPQSVKCHLTHQPTVFTFCLSSGEPFRRHAVGMWNFYRWLDLVGRRGTEQRGRTDFIFISPFLKRSTACPVTTHTVGFRAMCYRCWCYYCCLCY